MNTSKIFYFIIFLLGFSPIIAQEAFITVENGKLIKDEKTYYFIGTNLWYGMWLGSPSETGNRERLIRELDRLQSIGVNNLRIMVASEGPEDQYWRVQPAVQYDAGKYDEALLKGLDFLLLEMKKRNMTGVLVMNNFFQWSGGMAQYVSWATGENIPYPHLEGNTWDQFQQFSAKFYLNKKAQRLNNKFIKKMLKRRNSISGLKYKKDPVIMAWQLGNEPRGFGQAEAYLKRADKTAGMIQRRDKNHLVSLGGEGVTSNVDTGNDFETVSQSKHLDYLTAHLWIENWSWYDPASPESYDSSVELSTKYLKDHIEIARKVSKPIVFEEFGVSRDKRNYAPEASTIYRDRYYQFFFDFLEQNAINQTNYMGCNFWSWAGEGYPVAPGEFWNKGDVLTGDPPHELQGWYSVYDKDGSTLEIIKTYIQKLENARRAKP